MTPRNRNALSGAEVSERPSGSLRRCAVHRRCYADKTSMRNQELFNLMAREHGLTLLESEMHEIEIVVARTLATDREHDSKPKPERQT